MCCKNLMIWKKKLKILNVNKRLNYTIYKNKVTYYLKCRKNTGSKNPKFARTKTGRITLL